MMENANTTSLCLKAPLNVPAYDMRSPIAFVRESLQSCPSLWRYERTKYFPGTYSDCDA